MVARRIGLDNSRHVPYLDANMAPKKRKTVRLNLRVPPKIRATISRIADAQDRTQNAVATALLAEAIADRDGKGKS